MVIEPDADKPGVELPEPLVGVVGLLRIGVFDLVTFGSFGSCLVDAMVVLDDGVDEFELCGECDVPGSFLIFFSFKLLLAELLLPLLVPFSRGELLLPFSGVSSLATSTTSS